MSNTFESAAEHRDRPQDYWTLSTTAMTQREANEAAQLVGERFPGVFADAVDPRVWMTLQLDRATAEMLRDAVAMFVSAGGDAGNMLEAFEHFLANAHLGEGED